MAYRLLRQGLRLSSRPHWRSERPLMRPVPSLRPTALVPSRFGNSKQGVIIDYNSGLQ